MAENKKLKCFRIRYTDIHIHQVKVAVVFALSQQEAENNFYQTARTAARLYSITATREIPMQRGEVIW